VGSSGRVGWPCSHHGHARHWRRVAPMPRRDDCGLGDEPAQEPPPPHRAVTVGGRLRPIALGARFRQVLLGGGVIRQLALLMLWLPSAPAAAQEISGAADFDLTKGIAGLDLGDNDLTNNERLGRWLGEAYHSAIRFDDGLWRQVRTDLESLVMVAKSGAPALALALGTAFYSYYFWLGGADKLVDLQAGEQAIEMTRLSIDHGGCADADLDLNEFFDRQCQMRWRQLMLLEAEMGQHLAVDLHDIRSAARALGGAHRSFDTLRKLPFSQTYLSFGVPYAKPHDLNYNMDHYPHVRIGPVWPSRHVPLASFLEEHYEDFKADLHRILEAGSFWDLHRGAFISETQFTPQDDDWQTVYMFANQKWVERNCDAAPRTCELLKTRPEIAGCRSSSAGAGFLRLRPGARLKPHFGNSPRLTAHLGLVTPELGDIHLRVGDATVKWAAGRAVIFDDTYIHRVQHDGLEPRFIFHLWFCHPCDSENWDNPPEKQPEVCQWPR